MSISETGCTTYRSKTHRADSSHAAQKKSSRSGDESSAKPDPSPNADAPSEAGAPSVAVGELVWLDPVELATPYANLLRPGTPEEDDELRASVHASGIQIPLTVTRTHRRVLDGHRRRQQAIDQRFSLVPCLLVDGLSDEEERARAVTLNAVRRHLSPDEKRILIRDLLSRTPETSNRQIAHAVGVTHNTVGKQRKQLEDAGAIPQSNTRRGADGKNRAVNRNATAAPHAQKAQILLPPHENAQNSVSPLVPASPNAVSTVETAPGPRNTRAAVAPAVSALTSPLDATEPVLHPPVAGTDLLTELASAVDGCESRIRQLIERAQIGQVPPVAPAAVRVMIDKLHRCARDLSRALPAQSDEEPAIEPRTHL